VPGDKIGYLVTKKGTKLYDKARPYFEVTSDEVDTEYYVSGQVAPAAARILRGLRHQPGRVALWNAKIVAVVSGRRVRTLSAPRCLRASWRFLIGGRPRRI